MSKEKRRLDVCINWRPVNVSAIKSQLQSCGGSTWIKACYSSIAKEEACTHEYSVDAKLW